ncbi:hypothetical protein [Luteibacter yeojuensis]|uniref:hypothetical protein n=1 Tax=Luteibacter yeojuensis TaxID=345309 RepID=UPI0012ED56C9|nr:hypothetical protein [Luteibacter yeojuensis]
MKSVAFVAVLTMTSETCAKASEEGLHDAVHIISVAQTEEFLKAVERMWEVGNRYCEASGKVNHRDLSYRAADIAGSIAAMGDELGRKAPYQRCAVAAMDVAVQMLNCGSRRSKQATMKLQTAWKADKERCLAEIRASDSTSK